MPLSAVKMKKRAKSAGGGILVLHGPNLNLLGTREPEIYGHETLAAINRRLEAAGRAAGVPVRCFQSNHEGLLVDRVQRAKREGVRFIILNPAGLTHTSVVLRDALLAVRIPFIEVHLSNLHAREPWRKHSYFTDIAAGTVFGLGSRGYDLALGYALSRT
jgi:3-dehydroquinate dehydratase-2